MSMLFVYVLADQPNFILIQRYLYLKYFTKTILKNNDMNQPEEYTFLLLILTHHIFFQQWTYFLPPAYATSVTLKLVQVGTAQHITSFVLQNMKEKDPSCCLLEMIRCH